MPSNDLIILDKTLEQRKAAIAEALDASVFFELFVTEQLLKDYDLTYDELEMGHVAGGGDGGIDTIYIFANGELVQDDTDLAPLKRHVALDLVIVQAKTQASFTEDAIDKLIAVSRDLLNLGANYEELIRVYNQALLSTMKRFKQTYEALADRFPKFTLTYHYATRGDTPHDNVSRKVSMLRDVVRQQFSTAETAFHFSGAQQLLELARRSPRTSHTLRLAETPISTTGAAGFIGLVHLGDFNAFITDDSGGLLRTLFEANVRDYQGLNEVNQDIQTSLRQRGREEFWWLNNGITILATRATLSGKALTLEEPQIVNGLQTSTQLFDYFKSTNTDGDTRSLLVRVVVPEAGESRDKIIKATNNQTRIPVASLRATEKIHRDIEEYLGHYSLYYDRRKNFYKNAGKPLDKIVSIAQLGQSVMALALQRPDTARARPSSLLKNDAEYGTVFNEDYPIALYLFCTQAMRRVDAALKATNEVATDERNNLRFHVGMVATALTARRHTPAVRDVARLQADQFDDRVLTTAIAIAASEFGALGRIDQVAKGPQFVERLKVRIQEHLASEQ